jgi:glyceraldehyde-3-phosphate dehydrogenase/erythrose-4-phosphate dehydrogenase
MYLRKISSAAVRVPRSAVSVRTLSSEVNTSAMIQQVAEQQKERAARVVPWFINNMPVRFNLFHLIGFNYLFALLIMLQLFR